MKATIRGETWTVEIGRVPSDSNGICNFRIKRIRVKPSKKTDMRLWLHEILHAQLPDYDEPAIERMTDEIAGTLQALYQLYGGEK